MTSGDPCPGKKYAIMARKHIAALRYKESGSASRFGGALTTMVLWAMRSPMSGPSRPPINWTPMEWSGSTSRTHTASSGRDVSRSRGPSLTSSVTSQNENGRRVSRKLAKTANRKHRPRNRTPSWQAPADAFSLYSLSYIFWRSASGRLRLHGSGATLPYLLLHLLHATYIDHGNIHK